MRNKISILTLSLLGIASVFVENDATARRSNVRAFKQSQMAKKVIKASDATNSSGAVITPNANNTVTTASDCPAGTYFDGSSSCVGCPIGTWSGAGATSCTTCGDNVATCNATNGNPISCQSGYKVEGTICVVDSNSGADPDEIARFKELKQKYALQVAEVSASCSGIAAELERISGLNKVATVSSGVGTLAAGGAVATSMMKAHEDNKTVDQKKEEADKAYAEWHNKVVELDGKIKSKSELTENDIKDFNKDLNKLAKEVGKNYTSKTKEELESNSGALSNFSADEYKDVAAKDSSKTLGNVTTGLMAGATLTSGTSAVTSYVASAKSGDVMDKIKECNSRLEDLRVITNALNNIELAEAKKTHEQAQNILNNCSISKNSIEVVKNLTLASGIVSTVGTATAGAGTITSAMSNSDKRSDEGKKGLNTATVILAGVTTGTSGASTITGGIAWSKINPVIDDAKKCEDALRENLVNVEFKTELSDVPYADGTGRKDSSDNQ